MDLQTTKTERGFALVEFTDFYGKACSIQQSSIATEDAIWIGIDDPEPKIMASNAMRLGRADLLVPGQEVSGWVPWPLPQQVSMNTRMHLTAEQVKELLPILQHFAETGELP